MQTQHGEAGGQRFLSWVTLSSGGPRGHVGWRGLEAMEGPLRLSPPPVPHPPLGAQGSPATPTVAGEHPPHVAEWLVSDACLPAPCACRKPAGQTQGIWLTFGMWMGCPPK